MCVCPTMHDPSTHARTRRKTSDACGSSAMVAQQMEQVSWGKLRPCHAHRLPLERKTQKHTHQEEDLRSLWVQRRVDDGRDQVCVQLVLVDIDKGEDILDLLRLLGTLKRHPEDKLLAKAAHT